MSKSKVKRWMGCTLCEYQGYHEREGEFCPKCEAEPDPECGGFMCPLDPPPNVPVAISVTDAAPKKKTRRKPAKEIRVVGAVMVREGYIFAARRAPHKSLAGQWEFPGGKPEDGETPEQALAREMREEFGVEVEVGIWLGQGEASTDDARIILDVYTVRLVSGKITLTDHDASGWFDFPALKALDLAEADRALLSQRFVVPQMNGRD